MNTPTCPLCHSEMRKTSAGQGFIGHMVGLVILLLGVAASIGCFPIGLLPGIPAILVGLHMLRSKKLLLRCVQCRYTAARS